MEEIYFFSYHGEGPEDEDDPEIPTDPYDAWGMEKPEPGDDIDSDFGNWGND